MMTRTWNFSFPLILDNTSHMKKVEKADKTPTTMKMMVGASHPDYKRESAMLSYYACIAYRPVEKEVEWLLDPVPFHIKKVIHQLFDLRMMITSAIIKKTYRHRGHE